VQVFDANSAYEHEIPQEDGTDKNETIDELTNLQDVCMIRDNIQCHNWMLGTDAIIFSLCVCFGCRVAVGEKWKPPS
jgi:hypothetical protein